MKKTLLTTLLWISAILLSIANTTDHHYLKIEMENNQTISYPPETGFVVEDDKGNTILSPKELKHKGTYEISSPITLYVFVSWNDVPDVYEMSRGTLSLNKTDYSYKNTYGRAKKGENYGKSKSATDYGAWKGNSNGVYLMQERYFNNGDDTGFNTSLEFSNGVIFYYKNGEASAWQNGNTLIVDGKYLVQTPEGVLKISYNPSNKELWWVYEKTK